MARQEISEEDRIIQGRAIKRLIEDPVVQRVKLGLELEYFEEWKTAEDRESAEEIRAKSRALDDLWDSFRRVVASGDHATLAAEKRDKPPAI